MQHFCKRVFYWEGWLLLVTGIFMFAFPTMALEAQGFREISDLAAGNLAQFASMCLLMGYVGVFAPVLREVVLACLIADVLWLVSFVPLVLRHGDVTTPGSIFSIGSVLFLASVRIRFLTLPSVFLHRDTAAAAAPASPEKKES